MPERELWIPNLLLFVFFDSDAPERPIVLDIDFTFLSVDVYGDGRYLFRIDRITIDGVDENFVKNLEKCRCVYDSFLFEAVAFLDPILFTDAGNWTNIRIWSL
jgi:hypothetical protein